MIKIGAQLFTVRDFTKTPEMVRETFKKIANIGYKCVQVSGIGPIEAQELDDIAKASELEIVVTHTNPTRVLNETQKVIDEHKIFGCTRIGMGSIPQGYSMTIEDFKRFIADFQAAAKLISDNGMQFYYHNHDFEFVNIGGTTLFDMILEQENWCFLPDVYWIQYAGKSPAQVLKQLKSRSEVIHIKDMATTFEERKQIMTPVLSGNIDFCEIFESAEKSGVKYAMVEQDDCYGKDPFDELKTSFDNLKKAGYIK